VRKETDRLLVFSWTKTVSTQELEDTRQERQEEKAIWDLFLAMLTIRIFMPREDFVGWVYSPTIASHLVDIHLKTNNAGSRKTKKFAALAALRRDDGKRSRRAASNWSIDCAPAILTFR
jgi:hypothetical protein